MAKSSRPASTPTTRLVRELKVIGGGLLAGGIALPYLLQLWVPTWIVAIWFAVYVVHNLFFLTLISITESIVARTSWEIITALMYGSLSASVLIWGRDHPHAGWMVATVCFSYLAFEVATAPHISSKHWYVGIVVVGAAVTILAFVELGTPYGVAAIPMIAGIGLSATENKDLSNKMASRLSEAETMLVTDSLTRLLNRRGLEEALAALEDQEATVAIFDADRFKLINDTHGHGVGDQALRLIAEELRSTMPAAWRIARLGGDEFVAVAQGSVDLPSETSMSFQMALHGRSGEVPFSMSCGLASGTACASGDRLLSEAGYALRHAKRNGKRVVRSEGDLRRQFDQSVAITSVAVTDERIVPVVQPIVDDRGVVGCEMLARWKSDDGTLLAPGQFMDMLKENGLMARLDNVMIGHAVKLAAHLEHEAGLNIFVSANISASHLLDPGLITTVGRHLRRHGVTPDRLMIEITESERLGSDRRWERSINGLCELGVKLAIDDFGAGYSNVARLNNLPITHLKLDRTLVTDSEGPLGEIVEGVTRFCHQSGIGVIAEGIEESHDHHAMRAVGIDLFQGYLFGRPARVADFLRDLHERTDANPSQQTGAAASVAS